MAFVRAVASFVMEAKKTHSKGTTQKVLKAEARQPRTHASASSGVSGLQSVR